MPGGVDVGIGNREGGVEWCEGVDWMFEEGLVWENLERMRRRDSTGNLAARVAIRAPDLLVFVFVGRRHIPVESIFEARVVVIKPRRGDPLEGGAATSERTVGGDKVRF